MRLFRGSILAVLLLASATLLAAVPQPIPKSSDGPALKADPAPAPTPTEPTLTGDDTAEFMAEFQVKGVPVGSAVVWDVSPEDSVRVKIIKSEKALVFGGAPATYTVKARITKAEDIVADLRKTVVITGKKPGPLPPAPPPGPGPQPPPVPPGPSGAVSTFVVVEDTTKAGPWRGDVLGSPKVESFYKSLRGGRTGAIHRLIDVNGDTTDPVAAWAVKAAAGKMLPYLWMLDANGGIVKELPCPTTPDAFIAAFTLAAEPRSFGLIPAKLKFQWTEFGSTVSTPIIPRANWKPVTLQTFNGPVRDQDGRGQCVASATCSVLEACRAQAGLPYVYLSAGDLYSNINGGRDNGAILEDAMQWITKFGVATTASVPYVWDGRKHTTAAIVAERKNYMAVEVYTCPTFDAAASAIQQGFHLVEALTWYNSYMSVGKDGWLPPPGRGVAGGHALHGYALVQKADAWGIGTKNSWNTSFGGSADGTVPVGCCVITESNFDNIPSNGFFAVRAVVQTPTTNVPVPKAAIVQPFREHALAW